MLPTVEQVPPVRKSFPRPRVDPHSTHASASLPWPRGSRTVADLGVELRTETRPTDSLSRRTWREVSAAAGSGRGRGSP